MRKPLKIYVSALLLLLLLTPSPLNAEGNNKTSNMADEFARRLAIFSINVYEKLSLLNSNENIVISPFSIQTCVAMARMGAEGETARQIDLGLGFESSDIKQIAESFGNVLSNYKTSNILHIANKIYVMQGFELRDEFNQLLTQNFYSTPESIDFNQSKKAADTINGWVEERTNHLIKDLVPHTSLNSESRVVLVNAVHFKGTWTHQFPEHATHDETFYLTETETVNVPMMNIKKRYRYADLPNLDATALELPYSDSNLSMLVVLPNKKTGLQQLIEKLKSFPLSDITQKMSNMLVVVKLPKFKAEYSIELTNVFREMGMPLMFTPEAEFGKMLKNHEKVHISAIIHKGFIDVNESGTEAAAATSVSARSARSIDDSIQFYADHPFIYVLAHRKAQEIALVPLFIGSLSHLRQLTISKGSGSNEHDEL